MATASSMMPIGWGYHNVITSETPPPKLSPKTISTDDDYERLDRALRDLSDDQRFNDFITRLNYVIEDIVRKKRSEGRLSLGHVGGLHQMNRKGVEFTVTQLEPGLWKWQFKIGETVTTGKTHTNLMGMAARRVQQLIDRELSKPRKLAS